MATRATATFKVENWELTGLTGEGTFEAGMGSEGRRSVALDYEV